MKRLNQARAMFFHPLRSYAKRPKCCTKHMETTRLQEQLRSLKWYTAALSIFALVGWGLAAFFLKNSIMYSSQASTYAHFAASLRARAEYNEGKIYQLVGIKEREARKGFQTNNGVVFKEHPVLSDVDSAFIERFNSRMIELNSTR